jgi:hypothetical protein
MKNACGIGKDWGAGKALLLEVGRPASHPNRSHFVTSSRDHLLLSFCFKENSKHVPKIE